MVLSVLVCTSVCNRTCSSEFFSFWLGSVVEAQSGCGVLSLSVFHSLW